MFILGEEEATPKISDTLKSRDLLQTPPDSDPRAEPSP